MKNENKYPIKVVSQQTGLSQFVIRAWEKRYNAVDPERSDNNRRLYSQQDVEKLKLLSNAIKLGHNIGGIAHLSSNDLKELIGTQTTKTESSKDKTSPLSKDDYSYYIDSSLSAISSYNSKLLESLLLRASINFPQPKLLSEIIIPLIQKIGDMWKTGELRIAHEHLASAVIKTFLSNILDNYNIPESAPGMVIATPVGQHHELGAMIVSVVAASEGWRVTYLGSNLPAEEIASAVDQTNSKVLAMSIIYPQDDFLMIKEIKRIKSLLLNNSKFIVGGSGIDGYNNLMQEIGVQIISDIQGFRKALSQIISTKYN